MNLNRRDLVAYGSVLAASALSGCTGLGNAGFGNGAAAVGKAPAAAFEMDAVTDAEIAERTTHSQNLSFEGRNEERELVANAVAGESPRAEGTDPPVHARDAFVYEGAVYELSHAVVDSEPATSFQITLNPADGEIDGTEAVEYDDLPEVDRETFERRGWSDIEFLGFGTSLLYLDDTIEESALVPEPEYSVIVWDAETRGRFDVRGSYDAPLNTYEYEAELIHESASGFGSDVRERCEFELEGLSADRREIVSRAIAEDHGYTVPHGESVPDAMRALADQFRSRTDVYDAVGEEKRGRDEVDQSPNGNYLVRYEGQTYWTSLRVVEERVTTADS
ncbi:hypothetical protein [Halegenticoccus soli]|uniref:hypothetical protein n=1 Tax=Halegenticoccus soli TaxID=1985678 RepID=UPI000C6E36DD|nr:hypothetical protein [Halegenticoccus soli]